MDRADGAGPGAAASRAERFEDEKRRIIDTCFNKKDTDGSLLETYITHIRITEYSSHPSSPPPPQARSPESEKPRVIIVAVRKSGRVRMHKSKENTNGSFSIGKTWNLDDLSHIESYTNPQINVQQREWAGDTGFLVTLGKSYFWHAQTDKEKKFFIASLIKIYGKYTGGKMPELSGFDQKELDQVLGAGGRRPGPSSRPPSRPSLPDSSISPPMTQSPPSTASPPPAGPLPIPPDASRFQKGPPGRPPLNGSHSPAPSYESSASRDRSQPPPRWVAQNNKSQDSVATSFATTIRSEDASSIPPRSRNGMVVAGAPGRFGEPREPSDPTHEPPPLPSQGRLPDDGLPPPERRRPPMDPSRPQDRDLVPPPLMSSPNSRKDPLPPPRNVERASPEKAQVEKPIRGVSPEASRGRDTASPGTMSLNSAKSANGGPPAEVALPPADSVSPPQQSPTSEEEPLPSLNPMLRPKKSKGEIAGTFWKAATAASAFKPRPGGAADRLRNAQTKPQEGPDGITGVVPAPSRAVEKRPATPEVPPVPAAVGTPPALAAALAKAPAESSPSPRPVTPSNPTVEPVKPIAPKEAPPVPDVKLTVPDSNLLTNPPEQKEEKKVEEVKQAPRRTPSSIKDSKYLQALGIDAKLLDDRSEEFGKWLDFFGWVPGDQMRSRTTDELKVDIDRELNKAQAGGWLSRFREEDERVDAIKRGIDLAMSECEELDNLLTLYSVELSTLSDDISYIEAQGQGLQVQTANQKLLKKELESLLETCAITSHDLEALRIAPLENIRGLQDIESSLVTLYKAMMKIDPTLGEAELGNAVGNPMDPEQALGLNSDYGKMRIVQEKKEMYTQESSFFMRRLVEFMARQFDEAYNETKRALDGALSKKVDASHHDAGRDLLWKYSPLMLYARDADLDNWNRLIQIYQDKSHPIYKSEFQNVVAVWRKNAKKMTGEEAELLFTFQIEKQQEGVATTAKKITVKRSQTLARALRSPLADSQKQPEKRTAESRNMPYEVFLGVLDDLLPLVEMEQNFVIDFFHATTLSQSDFPDSVAAFSPRDRRGGDLKRHRLMEPDRELARRVTRSMEVIFSFLEMELQKLIEWVISQDPLQGVGVLAILDKRLGEIGQSNQDFLNMLLQKLQDVLEGRFIKFVDEQIRAIEETKVKINKRKGVIAFIRVFPAFMTAVENMLAGSDPNAAPRRIIDREYDRILKSMFDSLMVIAREHPTAGMAAGGSTDPEGKEALNFHILLIENMNHFLEETDGNNLEMLEEWKDQANSEYHEHMGLYLNAVMRRPLGKLLDQLENIETQIQSGKPPSSIARQPSNNKAIFSKILGVYDSKEVRKGIETLKKRVEKHFGDADDPALSRGLVAKVLNECEQYYESVESRIGRITTDVYGGDVPFEWPRADVKAAFK